MNDTVILEMDGGLFAVDNNPEVVRIANEGFIALPEYNTLQKVSNEGAVVSYGSKCAYKFKLGQRVVIRDVNLEKPLFVNVDGKQYRIVIEQSIQYAWEEDGS